MASLASSVVPGQSGELRMIRKLNAMGELTVRRLSNCARYIPGTHSQAGFSSLGSGAGTSGPFSGDLAPCQMKGNPAF